VHIRDLGAVVLANPKISITQNALAELADANVCVIASNAKRQPVSMMLPLVAHSTQTERFELQATSKPRKKRLWATGRVPRSKLSHVH
jgi:CRISPR-associated protein Cas1